MSKPMSRAAKLYQEAFSKVAEEAAARANLAGVEPVGTDSSVIFSGVDPKCKWPIGDPAESTFGFCGHATVEGSPYCAEHSRAAFQPAKKRERAIPEPVYKKRSKAR